MKTVEMPGVKIDDVGQVWHDLLQKGFDVETVGVNENATFIYVNDEEEKDPRPIVEGLVGKGSVQLNRSQVEARRKEIMALLNDVKKRRAEKAAARAQEETERRLAGKPELKVSATGQPGPLGIVEALSNGVDSHTVLIQKVDPDENVVEGSEELAVSSSHKVPISNASPKLDGGMAMIQVGPSTSAGDLVLEVKDRSGKMKPAKLSLRFVAQLTEGQEQAPVPPLEKNGGIAAVLRKVFGI